jgi:nitrite reductase/ring-hydroxylating ferredoxin subunit/uncharacterized membrane protein
VPWTVLLAVATMEGPMAKFPDVKDNPMPITRLLQKSFTGFAERVGAMPGLDPVAARLHALANPVFGPDGNQSLKDALYGTWLGHPLHPVMTDLPIGFWTSSFVLDLAGMERGADITLKLGTVSALGTAITGYAQWHDLQEMDEPRRIGTLHAMLNVAAAGSYALSWILRDTGRRRAGYVASTAGMSLASVSGLLGGDLAYRLGIGVSRGAFEDLPAEWTAVAILADLPEGELVRLEETSDPLMALRTGADVRVTAANCTHVGGPLDEGELDGTCVTCPWHGSVFDLEDGTVLDGPATTPLATLETRIRDGLVEVRTGA